MEFLSNNIDAIGFTLAFSRTNSMRGSIERKKNRPPSITDTYDTHAI